MRADCMTHFLISAKTNICKNVDMVTTPLSLWTCIATSGMKTHPFINGNKSWKLFVQNSNENLFKNQTRIILKPGSFRFCRWIMGDSKEEDIILEMLCFKAIKFTFVSFWINLKSGK